MNPTNMPAKRVAVYDYIRLFGILLVVFGHTGFMRIADELDLSSACMTYNTFILVFWRKLVGYIYCFHMPLFFILSGAVYGIVWKHTPEPGNYLLFLKKKARRLLVPFVLYGVLYMVPIKYLCGYYKVSFLKAETLLLLGTNENGAYWFLLALFWCFLLAGALRILNWKLFHGRLWTFLLAGVAVNYAVAGLLHWGRFDFYNLSEVPREAHFLCFLFGIAFEHCRERWNNRLDHTKALPWIIGGISLVILKYPVCALVNGIAGWCFFYLLARLLIKYWPWHDYRWFSLTTRNLFGIYLWHDPLNYVILYFVVKFHWLEHPAGVWAMYLLRFAGIFVLSLVLSEATGWIVKHLTRQTAHKPGAGI